MFFYFLLELIVFIITVIFIRFEKKML